MVMFYMTIILFALAFFLPIIAVFIKRIDVKTMIIISLLLCCLVMILITRSYVNAIDFSITQNSDLGYIDGWCINIFAFIIMANGLLLFVSLGKKYRKRILEKTSL